MNPNETRPGLVAEDAKKILAKGREVKYAKEMHTVIDRAVEHLGAMKAVTAHS